MPSIALTTFYPGDQTTVIMLDHNHRYLTAFDRPIAANVAHVIVFDSGRRLLSNLKFNCRICNLATEAGGASTNAIDLLDFGPPPAYEVDRELPDYHQQDQERTGRDRPRGRRRSQQQAQIVVRLPVERPRRAASGSPVRARRRGREALERALRVQAEVVGRDFQPLIPQAPPAVPIIARDFQPDDPTVQPESEQPAENLVANSPAGTSRVQEERSEITSRDFQPLTPEVQPAAPVIERDFQPSNSNLQPVPEAPAGSPSRNTPVRVPSFSEVFDERHYEALARFTGEARGTSDGQEQVSNIAEASDISSVYNVLYNAVLINIDDLQNDQEALHELKLDVAQNVKITCQMAVATSRVRLAEFRPKLHARFDKACNGS